MSLDRSEVVINGKFLLAPLEGMPRVGREVTTALDALLGDGEGEGLRFRVLAPRGAAAVLQLRNIPVEEIGSRQGFGWEQIDFPKHLKGRYSVNFVGTAPLRKRRGCVVVHDAQFRSTPASHGWKSKLLFGVGTPLVAKSYQTIVTVSEFARSQIAQYGVTRRKDVHVIHNSADHVLARREDKSILDMLGLEAGSYLLANSYVHAHKNVRVLFEALVSSPHAPKLVLFGSSTPRDYLGRGIEVPDGVVFAGRVTDEALVALMKNAAAFLFPSTTEGFGLPPLEAMLLGCPTVCARAGAMPEVCGDGAWYAQPHDRSAWRILIDRLWSEPDARRALAAAGPRQAAKYQWSLTARQYLVLLKNELGHLGKG